MHTPTQSERDKRGLLYNQYKYQQPEPRTGKTVAKAGVEWTPFLEILLDQNGKAWRLWNKKINL